MKRVLALLLVAVFMAQSIQAQAAPTVASVQREIDRLRTLAAEKYEAANEATLKIKALQKETGVLQQREEVIQKELSVVSKVLAKLRFPNIKEVVLVIPLNCFFPPIQRNI